MSGPILPGDIDPVIHERVRLGIVSALAVSAELSFNDLKSALSLTDGNLSTHARILEEAGYLRIRKAFEGRRPLTSMSLTAKGRKAFQAYVSVLRRTIGEGGGENEEKR